MQMYLDAESVHALLINAIMSGAVLVVVLLLSSFVAQSRRKGS